MSDVHDCINTVEKLVLINKELKKELQELKNANTSINKQSKPLQSCNNSACEDYVGVCAGKLCEFRE